MALPATVTLIPVEGTLKNVATGAGAQGYVIFHMPVTLRDLDNNVVLGPGDLRATLDNDGYFTIDLPATDDPDLTPLGWQYEIRLRTTVLSSAFKAPVPIDTVGTLKFAAMMA